eukprot:m.180778 g.180778  ORF g.180778 m.180778 type:complete len:308 (+) comp17434_c2_seq3:3469-4392(+)
MHAVTSLAAAAAAGRIAQPCRRCAARLSTRLFASSASTASDPNSNSASSSQQQQRQTHFGFQSVPESEKEAMVGKVFRNVAGKYDLMNDVMSVGVHRLWKDHFVQTLDPYPGTRLLDVAGGTGDIALRFLSHARRNPQLLTTQPAHVFVCDINPAMLQEGKKRAEAAGESEDMTWIAGNAESLPMKDQSVDAYTIAFGIRNVTHIDKALEEAYRVLVPGGRFLCLEFSQVPNTLIRKLYDLYSFQMIPVMGELVAGDMPSYQYLVESIRRFPDQQTFSRMIRDAGFRNVTYENLSLGVVAIHSGFKL